MEQPDSDVGQATLSADQPHINSDVGGDVHNLETAGRNITKNYITQKIEQLIIVDPLPSNTKQTEGDAVSSKSPLTELTQNHQANENKLNLERDREKNQENSVERNFFVLRLLNKVWKPFHTTMAIASGTILGLGYIYLRVQELEVSKLAIQCCASNLNSCPYAADNGSLEITLFTKDEESKQELIESLLSNSLPSKLKEVLGETVEGNVEVQLVQIGAVIATDEEFKRLEKMMKSKFKKVQWKIENDCKGSMIDFCCTLPVFQNKARMILQDISPEDAADYLECMKYNLENDFDSSSEVFKKRGFLAKHPDFLHFKKASKLHPVPQKAVIDLVKSLRGKQSISSLLWLLSDLFQVDPKNFLGDCEFVLRNLSKVFKTLVCETQCETARGLLIWMFDLLPNVAEVRLKSWIFIFIKLGFWLLRPPRRPFFPYLTGDLFHSLWNFAKAKFDDRHASELYLRRLLRSLHFGFADNFVKVQAFECIFQLLFLPKEKTFFNLASCLLRQLITDLSLFVSSKPKLFFLKCFQYDFSVVLKISIKFLEKALFKPLALLVKLLDKLVSSKFFLYYESSLAVSDLLKYSDMIQAAQKNAFSSLIQRKCVSKLHAVIYKLFQPKYYFVTLDRYRRLSARESCDQRRLSELILHSYLSRFPFLSTVEEENADVLNVYLRAPALVSSNLRQKRFPVYWHSLVSKIKPFCETDEKESSAKKGFIEDKGSNNGKILVESAQTKQGTELDVHSGYRKKLDSKVFIADVEDSIILSQSTDIELVPDLKKKPIFWAAQRLVVVTFQRR